MPTVASVLPVQAGTAVTEELIFRGAALQAIEQRWGSRAAVAATGLFFGAADFAWNTAEQLLGVPVSGHAPDARLWNVHISGSQLLAGGSFGLEASVVPVVIGLLLAVPMFAAARRRGNVVHAGRADRRNR